MTPLKKATSGKAGLFLIVGALTLCVITLSLLTREKQTASITLPPLPYAENALEPVISSDTVALHYGKHQAGYVAKANQLLKHSRFKTETIEEIILETAGDDRNIPLFNTAAQAWNHDFFWKCLSPKGGGVPDEALMVMINEAFGSYYSFRERMLKSATAHFGSGWVWLVSDGKTLSIITTDNADTPIAHGFFPLFTIDLWEHSYYLDYQNRRGEYINGILDNLINWEFVASRLE